MGFMKKLFREKFYIDRNTYVDIFSLAKSNSTLKILKKFVERKKKF